MISPGQLRRLEEMLGSGPTGLDGGAELEVANPDGSVAHRSALARHCRLVGDRVAVRPVPEGRAKALTGEVVSDGDELVFHLRSSGQVARVRPVGDEWRPVLEAWDTYFLLELDPEDQAVLEAFADAGWDRP